jgi:hypothetical protein
MTVLERSGEGPRAAIVENTVGIESSPEDVFDYCVDLSHQSERNPKLRRVAKLTDGPLGVGTRYKAEFTPGLPDAGESVPYTPATRGQP